MWCCQNTGKGCPLRQVGARHHGAVALRLHGGLCQLDGGVVRGQEDVVLGREREGKREEREGKTVF